MDTQKIETPLQYFETLPRRFVADAAKGVSAIFQWELTGDDACTYHAIVDGSELKVCEGAHETPKVTLKMNARDYVRVVNGDLNGQMAAMTGKLKVGGNILMARKMQKLFPVSK